MPAFVSSDRSQSASDRYSEDYNDSYEDSNSVASSNSISNSNSDNIYHSQVNSHDTSGNSFDSSTAHSPRFISDHSSPSGSRKMTKLSREQHLHNYDRLRAKLRANLSEANKGEASNIVLDHLNDLRSVYTNVQQERNRDTRIHLTDSEAFKETADFAATNARNLKFNDAGIALETRSFMSRLRRFASGDVGSRSSVAVAVDTDCETENDIDVDENEDDEDENITTGEEMFNRTNWIRLGILYHQVSRRAVSIDFLNGPLASERKKAVARNRNIDDTQSGAAATTAKHVQSSELETDEEKSTAHIIRSIFSTLQEMDLDEGVNFVKFFINPNSFAQSVENLFFISFLVRDGKLKVYQGPDSVPMVKIPTVEEMEEVSLRGKDVETNHHIANLDYATWEGLISTFNITESFLGHRDEEEDTIPQEDLYDEEEEPIQEPMPSDSESNYTSAQE
ncbi:hypothetical protein G9P44_003654 [Scheffersomyces stipitis]|nr:hypothetical protein G9P44_003654 [Scheffersomyces stipitis]